MMHYLNLWARTGLVVTALSLLISTPAMQASITSVSAGGVIIPAPFSALPGGTSGNIQQGFNEQQGVLLGAPLSTDLGVLPAGLVINSHMVFFNPAVGPGTPASPTWTFDGLIIGVMSDFNGSLEVASTPIVGNPGTIYPAAPFASRGLEPADGYSFIGNQLITTMALQGLDEGDWIRVITLTGINVPEPSTYLLFGGFLLVSFFIQRRHTLQLARKRV